MLSIIISLSLLIYYPNYFNTPFKLYTATKTTYEVYDQNIDIIRQELIEEISKIPVNNGILNNARVISYDGYEIFKEYTEKIETNISDRKHEQQESQQLIFEQETLKILERELKEKQQLEKERQLQLEQERKILAEKQKQEVEQKQQVEQEQQSQQNQQIQQIQPAISLSNIENQILILLNNVRTNHGLNPLNIDEALTNIARFRSKDMIDRGYFSHYTPDGKNISHFLIANGISYRAGGENLARSYPASKGSAKNLINAWMNSESHRINMLRGAYNKIGIGVIDQNNTRIVTIVFIG